MIYATYTTLRKSTAYCQDKSLCNISIASAHEKGENVEEQSKMHKWCINYTQSWIIQTRYLRTSMEFYHANSNYRGKNHVNMSVAQYILQLFARNTAFTAWKGPKITMFNTCKFVKSKIKIDNTSALSLNLCTPRIKVHPNASKID